jgi:hypothetical protein
MKDSPLPGTASSLIECNYFDGEVYCTIVPPVAGEIERRSKGSKASFSPVGRVKCGVTDSKNGCKFVWD